MDRKCRVSAETQICVGKAPLGGARAASGRAAAAVSWVLTELYESHFPVKNQKVHPVHSLCNTVEDNHSGEEGNTKIGYCLQSRLYILISHLLTLIPDVNAGSVDFNSVALELAFKNKQPLCVSTHCVCVCVCARVCVSLAVHFNKVERGTFWGIFATDKYWQCQWVSIYSPSFIKGNCQLGATVDGSGTRDHTSGPSSLIQSLI